MTMMTTMLMMMMLLKKQRAIFVKIRSGQKYERKPSQCQFHKICDVS